MQGELCIHNYVSTSALPVGMSRTHSQLGGPAQPFKDEANSASIVIASEICREATSSGSSGSGAHLSAASVTAANSGDVASSSESAPNGSDPK
jgi:hypothetical protein